MARASAKNSKFDGAQFGDGNDRRKILQGYKPTYRGGIFDATRIDKEIADYRAEASTPKPNFKAMDREGLDVAALYPSIGLGIMMRNEMDPKARRRDRAGLQQLAATIFARPIPSA